MQTQRHAVASAKGQYLDKQTQSGGSPTMAEAGEEMSLVCPKLRALAYYPERSGPPLRTDPLYLHVSRRPTRGVTHVFHITASLVFQLVMRS